MSDRIVGRNTEELRLLRIPAKQGFVLRCFGELCFGTVEALRRELQMLASLEQPVLTINLNGCRTVDPDGLLALLDIHRALREAGRGLVLVMSDRQLVHGWRCLGLELHIPLFPTEEAAARAFQGAAEPTPDSVKGDLKPGVSLKNGLFLAQLQDAMARGEWQKARQVMGRAMQEWDPDPLFSGEAQSESGVDAENRIDAVNQVTGHEGAGNHRLGDDCANR